MGQPHHRKVKSRQQLVVFGWEKSSRRLYFVK